MINSYDLIVQEIMKKTKWGIIGVGGISTSFAKDFAYVKNGEIVAAFARKKEKVEAFCKAFEISKSYTDLDDFLSDEKIEIVYIGTTNNSHYELALKAIEHKKAVLLEKPFTLNFKQTSHLLTLAKENKVYIMEALWSLFLPAMDQVRKWIEDDEIGNITHMTANFCITVEEEPSSRLYSKEMGGGSLLDVGIYPLLMFLTFAKSEVKRSYATGNLTKQGIDTFASFHLTFENGIHASGFSSIQMDSNRECVIYGNKGFIRMPDFWMANRAYLHKNGEISTYRDDSDGLGYRYEATHVSNDVMYHQLESKVATHHLTTTLSKTMDRIRKDIGVKYTAD